MFVVAKNTNHLLSGYIANIFLKGFKKVPENPKRQGEPAVKSDFITRDNALALIVTVFPLPKSGRLLT